MHLGRSDKDPKKVTAKDIPPNGRLPDAAQGAQHVRDIFYRMGFNDREIVALSGAHTLGRCHTDRSGFSGRELSSPNILQLTKLVQLAHIRCYFACFNWI
jgi:hypothetical protein